MIEAKFAFWGQFIPIALWSTAIEMGKLPVAFGIIVIGFHIYMMYWMREHA